jgi:hypothetical protein
MLRAVAGGPPPPPSPFHPPQVATLPLPRIRALLPAPPACSGTSPLECSRDILSVFNCPVEVR